MIRITKTENGTVKGIPCADPRITAFKGVPFAKPPVGKLRWRAPQPAENWDGVRECFEFAPISVQDTPGIGDDIYCREWHVDPDVPMSEDCLYLNIWTNAKSTDERLPVLVWYFGGGFQWGYTSEMEFDGERLARRGVVVVTVNYRLGAFGFIAHPEMTAEDPEKPCNFGSLDQQAGLFWVRRNIANFGGDPENITIAGQSAGGGSVLAQMASKQNEGSFQKACVFSGMFQSPYIPNNFFCPRTLSEAEKLGEQLFAELGVKTLDEARKLDADFIRSTYSDMRNKTGVMFTIANDGHFCTGDPLKAFCNGTRNRVPVFAGNTGDEFLECIPAADDEGYHAKAREIFGEKADEFLSIAPKGVTPMGYAPASPCEIGVKVAFRSENRLPDPRPCYYYRFVPDIPGDDHPGTFHSCDLWFFFDTIAKCSRPYTGRHYDIARQMCDYWVNFIKNGDPNGRDICGEELPEWERYTGKGGAEMTFTPEGAVPAVESDPLTMFLIDRAIEREDKS